LLLKSDKEGRVIPLLILLPNCYILLLRLNGKHLHLILFLLKITLEKGTGSFAMIIDFCLISFVAAIDLCLSLLAIVGIVNLMRAHNDCLKELLIHIRNMID
jgi:hypothetical protein